ARGSNNRARLAHIGLAKDLADGGVADEHGHTEPPRRGDEAAVAGLLDNDDALSAADQLFNDPEADVSEAADHDVATVRDAADFQRTAQASTQEIVGDNGRERRYQ